MNSEGAMGKKCESGLGFTPVGSYLESYDVVAHIRRAFVSRSPGRWLNVREVTELGRDESIPESLKVNISLIHRRIEALAEGSGPIKGLVGNYDYMGRLIVHKVDDEVNECSPPADSINNPPPTVECCNRDIADCDCHPLVVMYVEARKKHGDRADDAEEMAREAAIGLLTESGFDTDDLDIMADPMGDFVQSLLMTAFLRVPALGETVHAMLLARVHGDANSLASRIENQGRQSSSKVEIRGVGRSVVYLTAGLTYRVKYNTCYLEESSQVTAKFIEEIGEHTLKFSGKCFGGNIYIRREWILDICEVLA